MKDKNIKKGKKLFAHIPLRDFPIVVAIGCAALVWITESILHVLVFNGTTLSRQLFFPEQHELWMRLLVIMVIMLFGGYIQFTTNKRKQKEEAIERINRELIRYLILRLTVCG